MSNRALIGRVIAAAAFLLSGCKTPHVETQDPLDGARAARPRPVSAAEIRRAPQQLRSGDAADRLNALYILVTSERPQSVEPLTHALRTSNTAEQLVAILGLGLLGDPRGLEPLIKLAQTSENETVLAELGWALGRFGDEHAREPLVALLRRKVNGTRSMDRLRQVAYSLAAFGTREANEVILSDTGDVESFELSSVRGPLPRLLLDPGQTVSPTYASALAGALATRPECDAIGTILGWSRLPPPEGAPGLQVNAVLLDTLPQGCGAALREGVRALGGGEAWLLAGNATTDDRMTLQHWAETGPDRMVAAATMARLGMPMPADALPSAAVHLANPLEPSWPNRVLRERVRAPTLVEYEGDRDQAVVTRALQPVLKQLTGKGSRARYELGADLDVDKLASMALEKRSGPYKPRGIGAWVTLLGLSEPDGPLALAALLERTSTRSDHTNGWLRASVGLSLFEVETDKLVELSRASTPAIKSETLRLLLARTEPAAKARIQEVIGGKDPVAQLAVLNANFEDQQRRPLTDFVPMLKSKDSALLKSLFVWIATFGSPSDAAALALSTHEAEMESMSDPPSVLAAVEPERAEAWLAEALTSTNKARRERAEKWLNARLLPAASRVRSRLILKAIAGPESAPARTTLLALAPQLKSAMVWDLLQRKDTDDERRAFVASLDAKDPAVSTASAVALSLVVADYSPSPAILALMVAHAPRILDQLSRLLGQPVPFALTQGHAALPRGLVQWFGREPKLAPGLVQALAAQARTEELGAMCSMQPTRAVAERVLDVLPELVKGNVPIMALAQRLTRDHLPEVVGRMSRPDDPLRELFYILPKVPALSDRQAALPELQGPVVALLKTTVSPDDQAATSLRIWAINLAARVRSKAYETALQALAGSQPVTPAVDAAKRALDPSKFYNEQLAKGTDALVVLRSELALTPGAARLPIGLALGAAAGFRYGNLSELAELLTHRAEPELVALLPRLQSAHDSSRLWLEIADLRKVALPAAALSQALFSTLAGVPASAARQLTRAHDKSRWLAALTQLCANESLIEVEADTQGYTLEELSQAMSADRAQTRACALGLMARREPPDLVARLLSASRDPSPLVRLESMKLALSRPQPELAERALDLLTAGDTRALRPWALAVWLKSDPDAASRLHALGPLLRGTLDLPRIFPGDVDECSYWLPLAAIRDSVAEAQYLSFAFDRGNPGPAQACDLKTWLPLALSGERFLEHYERASRAEREYMVDALLDSALPLEASYARVLERIGPDWLLFKEPGGVGATKLLARLMTLPRAARKPLFEKLFRNQPGDERWERSVARLSTLMQ